MPVRMTILALVWVSLTVLSGCEPPAKMEEPPMPTSPATPAPASPTAAKGAKQADVTKLEITDLTEGAGAEAKPGKSVSVHYRGTLTDGTEFDASRKRGEPFDFRLGSGQVIRGWDEGVKGMKVGGKRKLVIPPDMGYGEKGAGGLIPPNATLVFEVELIDVR